MEETLQVTLEIGPKGRKVVAVAPTWPGLERGGSTADDAVATLQSYLPRYAPVAELAGMVEEFPRDAEIDIVERYPGTGSTDFWGISFAFSSVDKAPMSIEVLDHQLALMSASWRFFDDVRARVSAEMKKGPRGGGRDRDRIVRHVLGVEQDWAKKVGVRSAAEDVVLDGTGLESYRNAYREALRTFGAEGRPARNWPVRYLIRHIAYHAMDHAWEMEDKDMSGEAG